MNKLFSSQSLDCAVGFVTGPGRTIEADVLHLTLAIQRRLRRLFTFKSHVSLNYPFNQN